MGRKRRTMLLESPDAAGGIAVLADGTRVYWASELGPDLVARSADGTHELIPAGGPHSVRDAYAALRDRGAAVVRPLEPAEARELRRVVGEYGPSAPEPAVDEGRAAEPAAAEGGDVAYRVFPLPDGLREAVRTARDRSGATNRAFVAGAVTGHLPGLVRQLAGLGFGGDGPPRPVRLPFSRGAGTLDALRAASGRTGVPASQLLGLCLLAAARASEPAQGRRGRKPKVAAK